MTVKERLSKDFLEKGEKKNSLRIQLSYVLLTKASLYG